MTEIGQSENKVYAFDLAKLAKRVQFIRVEHGWNQKQLADLIGVTQTSISYLENQKFINPPIHLLFSIAEVAGVSPAYMLLLTDDPSGDVPLAKPLVEDPRELRLLVVYRQLAERHKRLISEVTEAVLTMAQNAPDWRAAAEVAEDEVEVVGEG